MTHMITKSLNKLFLVLSIIVLTGFISVSSAQSAPSQETAATSIAHACAGLIAGVTRNPTLEPQMTAMYNAHVDEVFAMKLPRVNRDIAGAKGIIAGAAIQGFARIPDLADRFNAVVAMCEEDIDAL